jgi:hypothetical protein
LNLLKKAASVGITATMLASLLATAAVGVASASTGAALSGACVPVGCTQVVSSGLIVLNGSTNTMTTQDSTTGSGALKLTVSGAGATFVAVSGGHFSLNTGTTFTGGAFFVAGEVQVASGATLSAADTVSVLGATAGTATVTEWTWTGSAGSPANTWLPDGNIVTLTFTASTASYQVSAALSTVATYTNSSCTVATSSAAASGGSAELCVTVVNTSGVALANASVTATITPYGLISAAQSSTVTSNGAGVAVFPLSGSTLAGKSTISVSATYLGVTTALTPVTFTWTGTPSTLKVGASKNSGTHTSVTPGLDALVIQETDATGNVIPLTLMTNITQSVSPAGAITINADAATPGDWNVVCVTAVADQAVTFSLYDTVNLLTSNTITYYCNSAAASTLVVVVANSSIPAGGSTTFTATAKDAAGHPVVDGSLVAAVASAGAVIGNSSTNISYSSYTNGVAPFTYLAVNTNGPVTVTAVDSGSGLTASGTIGVGQAPLPTPSSVSHAASALGVTTTGTFTTATKLPALGKYVTVKFYGLMAGAHVVVWIASKSGTTWSAFVPKSTRIADAHGNVYFYWKSASAAWLSFMISGGNSVQARWR